MLLPPLTVFDLTVVLFSILEICIDISTRLAGSGGKFPLPLSVLRAFRILRLFKLVRSVPSLRKILVTLAQSMVSVGYLALLLLLMIVIFILLGMELFGGFYPRPELNYTSYYFPSSSATGDVPLNWGYVEDPNVSLLLPTPLSHAPSHAPLPPPSPPSSTVCGSSVQCRLACAPSACTLDGCVSARVGACVFRK
jgi:hypothetical protein